jgi:formate dehydrogenase major subunit
MTNSIEELEQQDVIFITGSNPTEAHPVIGARMRQARQRGAKLIVADPRRIELADEAEIFLQLRPGTNIALYNSMMNVILEEGLEDRAYIQEKCEGFDELAATVKEYTPEK